MTTENVIQNSPARYVKVLYDYEYTENNDRVWMKEDEVFQLLNTESNEWWQVSRPEHPESPFYVPSTYVKLLNNGNDNSLQEENLAETGHEGNEVNTETHKHEQNTFNNNIKMDTQMDHIEQESDYMNVQQYLMPKGTGVNSFTVQYIPSAKNLSDIDDNGDYANLEEFRNAANIPQPPESASPPQSPGEGDYANMDVLRGELPPVPPNMEDCQFRRTLQDTWDQYLDPSTNRLFYIHKQTNEIQWKPPRGQFHNEAKTKRSEGSSPTKSPTSDPEETFPDQSQPPKLSDRPRRTQVSERFQKSRSVMIETLHITAPPNNTGPPGPKSATLPSKFPTKSAIPEVPIEESGPRRGSTPETTHSQPFSQSVNITEPIEGTLNKCRLLANGKKQAKKWANSYVKLSGSNLLFYKDQKASQPSKNQPHGKSEQIVALVDCSLEKDPRQFTSKKNTICITTPEHHILLQTEDDAKITEWFVKLHTKIQELGGQPDKMDLETMDTLGPTTPVGGITKKPSFKGKHKRTESDAGMENKGRLRDYLSRFMTNRTEKEKLVNKGIIKDAVFGSDINQLCEKEKTKVPVFVTKCVEAIEKRGLDHEGLYRIGGNFSLIQTLRCAVDQGEAYSLDDPIWDINILAGCLKLFFRELKEPLFTYALFDKFLKSFMKENAIDRLKAIKATVHELPKCNYETVQFLFRHLNNVMDHSAENKMQAHQLAIVFGPTLIWPEVHTGHLATSMVYQSRIVEFILLEYKNIFR